MPKSTAVMLCPVVAALALACTSHPSQPSAPALSLFSQSTDFGPVPVGGRSAPLRISAANRGEAPSGILSVSLTGAHAAEFALVRDLCTGQALQESLSCLVEVELRPATSGPKEVTLTLLDPRGADVGIVLHGSAADAGIGIAPAVHAFPPTTVGSQSAVQTLVVRNTGVQPTGVIGTQVLGDHPADFLISRNTCEGQALALADTCVIDVRFSPTAAGTRRMTVTVSASPGGSASAEISGAGAVSGASTRSSP